MEIDLEQLKDAARALREARSVVVVTGAGVSAESDIPTFRGGMEGLWAEFDPMTLATPEAFAADPETVTKWYDWRRIKCQQAEPNPGHVALARLERELEANGGSFTILTQNVDGLHRRAGTRNVVELHGSLFAWRCSRTDEPCELPDGPFEQFPPLSPAGHPMRPGVVWFGESLPEAALEAAFRTSNACDLFLSVGTSAVVYPAAGFLDLARANGARTIEINRDPTGHSSNVDWAFHAPSGRVLPRLADLAFGSG